MHVNHEILHPNGSVAHQRWAQDRTLHVAVAYCNPYRWRARQALFNDFRRHMSALPNVKLYVGELAYGERPFEVTSVNNPLDFQWRTREVLWHKENILNRVIERFDRDWVYGAYVDGDMNFPRWDIALETIEQLQLHEWVQMFSTLIDVGPNREAMRLFKSFGKVFSESGSDGVAGYRGIKGEYDYGADAAGRVKRGMGMTGGAWAFRRGAFDACGGLLDTCILGSGDWHMSYGLVGEHVHHPETDNCGKPYIESIRIWQSRALAACRKNIGCADCHAVHGWHSSRDRRGYGTRWQILANNNYDPTRDIYRDSNGIYQLRPDRIKFRDEIRQYFKSRCEDDIQLSHDDKQAVK